MDYYISLDANSINNIIGRGLIIHEDEDDCGFGIGDKKKRKSSNWKFWKKDSLCCNRLFKSKF
jgi:hypothetical protein